MSMSNTTGWSGSGASRTNAALIQWGKRTDGGLAGGRRFW